MKNLKWYLISMLPISIDSFVTSWCHHPPSFKKKPSVVSVSSSQRHIEGLQRCEDGPPLTPLSMNIDQLGSKLNGQGRALTTWDCYKIGLDPLYFFRSGDGNDEEGKGNENGLGLCDVWDENVVSIVKQTSFNFDQNDELKLPSSKISSDNKAYFTDRNKVIKKYMPMKRRDIHTKVEGKGMGHKALSQLSDMYPNTLGIEFSIASLVNVQRSSDGTVKLLLKLNNSNRMDSNTQKETEGGSNTHYYIESVIIPWFDRSHPKSTLCISSQVGCAQGCTFCATVSIT